MWWIVGVAIGVLAACDSETNVGWMCGFNDPACDESLECNTNVLGGYCTTPCSTQGSTEQCPGGSVCENVPELGGTVCVRICNGEQDCGRNNVRCEPVTATDLMACKPN